jgi:hypothetical protein
MDVVDIHRGASSGQVGSITSDFLDRRGQAHHDAGISITPDRVSDTVNLGRWFATYAHYVDGATHEDDPEWAHRRARCETGWESAARDAVARVGGGGGQRRRGRRVFVQPAIN